MVTKYTKYEPATEDTPGKYTFTKEYYDNNQRKVEENYNSMGLYKNPLNPDTFIGSKEDMIAKLESFCKGGSKKKTKRRQTKRRQTKRRQTKRKQKKTKRKQNGKKII